MGWDGRRRLGSAYNYVPKVDGARICTVNKASERGTVHRYAANWAIIRIALLERKLDYRTERETAHGHAPITLPVLPLNGKGRIPDALAWDANGLCVWVEVENSTRSTAAIPALQDRTEFAFMFSLPPNA